MLPTVESKGCTLEKGLGLDTETYLGWHGGTNGQIPEQQSQKVTKDNDHFAGTSQDASA